MQELNSDDEYEIDYEEELSQGAQEHGPLDGAGAGLPPFESSEPALSLLS